MRITIIGLNYAPEPTGIAPYTTGLAEGLAANGHSVKIVTAFPHYPAWKIADGYAGRRIREIINAVSVDRHRPRVGKDLTGLRRLLMEVDFGIRAAMASWARPDVVVLVSPALFATAIARARARLGFRAPSTIVWVQDIYSLGVAETGALGTRGASVMRRVESHVLRNADRVVVIHERFRQVLVSSLSVDPTKVDVVRNWTHLKPLNVDRQSYREKFGWGDEIVVLHAGNMGAKQALENVVSAARLADSVSAPVRFVLLGNGNQRDSLVENAQGITRLSFMEPLGDEDFQGAMAAADILLVNEKPGVAEMAVPSKLTSYFSAQRPVIVATDEGSITADEIAAANAGIRINAGDPLALFEAAIWLGSDVARSDELGRNGAAFQSRVLTAQTALVRFEEILVNLARSEVRPRGVGLKVYQSNAADNDRIDEQLTR